MYHQFDRFHVGKHDEIFGNDPEFQRDKELKGKGGGSGVHLQSKQSQMIDHSTLFQPSCMTEKLSPTGAISFSFTRPPEVHSRQTK